ncbi:hypothetical protein [Streptomyces sp. Je 1-369]|uniref:hypothetical protein n=1 Tax=Streptomyces sp. Je 1-369 TaxID=2966192 RepID=UPI0022859739|nr:hypothetical protein [Streptomyces sp. Je 1-369]WAL93985.1 hypothetical protein NOO62_05400 [Streptomyces sp. Je 1-369]
MSIEINVGDTVLLRRASGFAINGRGEYVQFHVVDVLQLGPDLMCRIKTFDREGQMHNGLQPADQLTRY